MPRNTSRDEETKRTKRDRIVTTTLEHDDDVAVVTDQIESIEFDELGEPIEYELEEVAQAEPNSGEINQRWTEYPEVEVSDRYSLSLGQVEAEPIGDEPNANGAAMSLNEASALSDLDDISVNQRDDDQHSLEEPTAISFSQQSVHAALLDSVGPTDVAEAPAWESQEEIPAATEYPPTQRASESIEGTTAMSDESLADLEIVGADPFAIANVHDDDHEHEASPEELFARARRIPTQEVEEIEEETFTEDVEASSMNAQESDAVAIEEAVSSSYVVTEALNPQLKPETPLSTAPVEARSHETPSVSKAQTRPVLESLSLDEFDATLRREDPTWKEDANAFRALSQKLARQNKWRELAAVTSYAIQHAPFATGMSITTMLLDLARIYRDRLNDHDHAEQAFAALIVEDPASAEALHFLIDRYQTQESWEKIYQLYLAAVEASWDPNERLEWTKQAAAIAGEKLRDIDRAIQAWERLWRLGDAAKEASHALSRFYRQTANWEKMAEFLGQQATRSEGAQRIVILRELAEILISGLAAPDRAESVLEQILEQRPGDPIATLHLARVYAQRSQWKKLRNLVENAIRKQGFSPETQTLERWVANIFWEAGELDHAAELYTHILSTNPADREANERRQSYLRARGQYDELISVLVKQAETSPNSASLLEQAARLADERLNDLEKSIELWRHCIALNPAEATAYQALETIYETTGDRAGIAHAIEGQLKTTRNPDQRIALLRRLGNHYARILQDDNRAETCWKEILSIDPSDRPVRDELTELHRRRGDFESLNSALMRQLWLTSDRSIAEQIARQAAQNLDENFNDAARSIEAWRRVLDFAPLDVEALSALATHYTAIGDRRGLIAILEQQIRAESSGAKRIELALNVAALWQKEGDPRATVAAFERIICWQPDNDHAIRGLIETYRTQGAPALAIGLCEHASYSYIRFDIERSIAFLEQALTILPENNAAARYAMLKRILFLSPTARHEALLQRIAQEAERGALWEPLSTLLLFLATKALDSQQRRSLMQRLSELYETKLHQKDKAFALQQALLYADQHDPKALAEVFRLSRAIERHEEYLALLDDLASGHRATSLDERKRLIQDRARYCEETLKDVGRAFAETTRLLWIDTSDCKPLEDLERLARTHNLFHELDGVLADLMSCCALKEQRLDLISRRFNLAQEQLKQSDEAFARLVSWFRLDPGNPELVQKLIESAEQSNQWAWVLPLFEAAQLSPVERSSSTELALTAELYHAKLDDASRAFTLCAEAFVMNPRSDELLEELESFVETQEDYGRLAEVLRLAAAWSQHQERTVFLLKKIAAIYEQQTATPERSVEIHRRLLDLKEDELPSLKVMIEWHRKRQEWRDLRDRLRQWLTHAPSEQPRLPALLEIAQISQYQLNDTEAAMAAYSDVLELDAAHAEAQAQLRNLVESMNEDTMRMRWLHIQLKNASDDTATSILLEIARLEEENLDDKSAAIATLKQLLERTGAKGPAFEPLTRLLREQHRWTEIVHLLKQRSDELTGLDLEQRVAHLEEAIAICQEHLAHLDEHTALCESLYRDYLELRPHAADIWLRLTRLLRASGRFEELVLLLTDELASAMDEAESIAILYDLARLYGNNLNRTDDAVSHYQRIVALTAKEEPALLALASHALRREDWNDYLRLRKEQAALCDAKEAALIFCHLAEFCDEHPSLKTQMVGFYREARKLDAQNEPAMEALKGIGRRLKDLRPGAALLPEEGEHSLSLSDRSRRLKARGDHAFNVDRDPSKALDWYRRSLAVDPNHAEAWFTLGNVFRELGDPAAAYRARRNWHHALLRQTPCPSGKEKQTLRDEAERIYLLAQHANQAGFSDDFHNLIIQAFELAPDYAPSTLARAEMLVEEGDVAQAHHLLSELLQLHRATLDQIQLVDALCQLGITARQLGKVDQATAYFREALQIKPLHTQSLMALAQLYAAQGNTATAIEHNVRALAVVEDDLTRAKIYYHIGVLWEDGLNLTDEAGACYQIALNEGLTERDLSLRALEHLRREGRLAESLQIIEQLLPTTTQPEELATLWVMKGRVLLTQPDREDQAMEAFDMALSYEPNHKEAREGLMQVLERRGEWDQLLQVLESSLETTASSEKGVALFRMAKICNDQLSDTPRAERYLRESVAAFPTKEALEDLELIYLWEAPDPEKHREVLGRLVAFGPPWFERCVELGKLYLDLNKRWAWCLLSPLLGVSQIDAEVKATIQAMRKEHDRPPILVRDNADAALLIHPDVESTLSQVLVELAHCNPSLGITNLNAVETLNPIAVSGSTTMGKAFTAIAEMMTLSDATLYRSQDLVPALQFINSPSPTIIVRTEVMQQLVHAEIGFLLGYAVELAQAPYRLLASLSDQERTHLVPAIWSLIGFIAPPDETRASLEKLQPVVDASTISRWKALLDPFKHRDPFALGKKHWQGIQFTALRAGLLAGPDLRQAFRVVSRLAPEIERPRVMAKIDELDEYVASSPILQDLVAFAASPTFGMLLERARIALA